MKKQNVFQSRLKSIASWKPDKKWQKITVLDAHTGGEPLRIVLNGLPDIKGKTILDKRRYMKEHLDQYRKLLMWEPRGHADMYGCIITEPETVEADFGVLFMHNEGYSTMCGHGIIAVTKAAVETGFIKAVEPLTTVRIDSPAGLITAYAKVDNQKVSSVYFHNVPSYVVMTDKIVDVEGLGKVKFDIAFGGAYYTYVNADELRIDMTEQNYHQLIEKGMAIKHAVMKNFPFRHPFQDDLSFLYGTIFIGKGHNAGADSRNVCIFADGEVDRSPTGTGVSARMALLYAKNALKIGEKMVIESIVGSQFICSIAQETEFGGNKAVIPQVEGNAYLCGKNVLLVDPDDLFQEGFFLR